MSVVVKKKCQSIRLPPREELILFVTLHAVKSKFCITSSHFTESREKKKRQENVVCEQMNRRYRGKSGEDADIDWKTENRWTDSRKLFRVNFIFEVSRQFRLWKTPSLYDVDVLSSPDAVN